MFKPSPGRPILLFSGTILTPQDECQVEKIRIAERDSPDSCKFAETTGAPIHWSQLRTRPKQPAWAHSSYAWHTRVILTTLKG